MRFTDPSQEGRRVCFLSVRQTQRATSSERQENRAGAGLLRPCPRPTPALTPGTLERRHQEGTNRGVTRPPSTSGMRPSRGDDVAERDVNGRRPEPVCVWAGTLPMWRRVMPRKAAEPGAGRMRARLRLRLRQIVVLLNFRTLGFSQRSDLDWLWSRVAGPGRTSCDGPGLCPSSPAQPSGSRAEGQVQPRALSPDTRLRAPQPEVHAEACVGGSALRRQCQFLLRSGGQFLRPTGATLPGSLDAETGTAALARSLP